MRWMDWRSIGHVPGYCFQCQAARSHELLELHLVHRRRVRTTSALYGHERRCDECGLRSRADASAASIRREAPIEEPEAALREAYGEDCFACSLIGRRQDIEAGLLDAAGRFDMIGRTFLAIGNHGDMPPLSRSVHRRIPAIVVFGAGFVLALCVGIAADLLLMPARELALPALLPIFFTAGYTILHSTEGKRLAREVALRRLRHDMAERLSEAVRVLEPSGFELGEAHRLAAERESLAAMLDPDDLLLRLGGSARGRGREVEERAAA